MEEGGQGPFSRRPIRIINQLSPTPLIVGELIQFRKRLEERIEEIL